jgi:hypothetical protein
MQERFSLFITDDEIILHHESTQKIYSYTEGIEHIQTELTNIFSLRSKIPLRLLIDRNHQDVREEPLPALWPWDRLRLLSHKKEDWTSQGKFHGYHFFKQDRKSFLQWINITQTDPLILWLSWAQSLSNPLSGVFFISLEAGRFLKKHFPSSPNYHMLIYKVASRKIRYVIFKDKRLLLFRPFQEEEDLRTSLHFLSRLYPDIHEKLQILNLLNDVSLTFPHVTTLSDPRAFVDFLVFQDKKILSLNLKSSSPNQWIGKGISLIFISSLILTCLAIYQGITYKTKSQALLLTLDTLKDQTQNRKSLLKNKDVAFLQSALEHYDYLQSQIKDPLKTFEKLSSVLGKYQLQLQSLIWNNERTLTIEIIFFMQKAKNSSISKQFNALLSSLNEIFPHSHIQVIEAPFKSGSQETYTYPPDLALPMAHLRIIQP